MAVTRPWIDGLRPVPGSGRLVLSRWLLFVAAAAPGIMAGLGGIGETIAGRPYFTESPDPLPLVPLIRLIGLIPGSVWGGMALAAAGSWLGGLLLTAGTVALFDPRRGGRPRVLRTVFDAGTRALWPYLRIALLALVLAAAGIALLNLVGSRLSDHGIVAGWTLRALFLLQLGRGLAVLGWLTLVGVFVWWCRVIVVADGRQRVRRLLTVVPRLWWRRPVRGLALHWLVALGGLIVASAVLAAWRQSAAGAGRWIAVWLAVLAGLAYLWRWRLRACRLLWADGGLDDLRALPDAPWGLFRRLAGRLGRRRAMPPTPAAAPEA